MLQLKRSKSGALELSDKNTTVELKGSQLKVGETTIDSPGEYEQAGVEVVYGNSAALIIWDHMQISYVYGQEKPNAFEKNQFSSTDVLLISESITSINKDQLSSLTDVYDPRMVIFGAKTELDKNYRDNIKPAEESSIKLNSQALPVEGRDYTVLT